MSGRPGLDARGLPSGYPYKPDLEVTPRQVKAALEAGGAVLVDCRTIEEWRTARIEGATLVPLADLAGRVGDIEGLLSESSSEVIVHCHHGARSLKAALFLRQQGIAARSMAGGIDLWSMDIDPAVPRY